MARLHPSLRAILELELARGNEVAGVEQSHYPRANQVFICLELPFARHYDEFEDVRFRRITSPPGWDDEYSVSERRQLLVCRSEQHA